LQGDLVSVVAGDRDLKRAVDGAGRGAVPVLVVVGGAAVGGGLDVVLAVVRQRQVVVIVLGHGPRPAGRRAARRGSLRCVVLVGLGAVFGQLLAAAGMVMVGVGAGHVVGRLVR